MRTKSTFPLLISLIASLATILDGVEGFAVCSQTRSATVSSSPFLVQNRKPSSAWISVNPSSYLKVARQEDAQNGVNKSRIRKFGGIFKRGTARCTTQLIRFWMRSRRSLLTISAAILFWFGAAGIHTQVSHGSSSAASTQVVSRNIFSSSLEQITDKYVKSHMFDDDVYDPVESLYREAMDDRIKGAYPKDLKETASSVLGQNVIKADKKTAGAGFSATLMKSVGFLRKQGLSEMQAIAVVSGFFVIGIPAVAVYLVMQIATQNKRSMNKLMKDRYGKSYTVDATEKTEDDVDAPDDDDEDDDDDDE